MALCCVYQKKVVLIVFHRLFVDTYKHVLSLLALDVAFRFQIRSFLQEPDNFVSAVLNFFRILSLKLFLFYSYFFGKIKIDHFYLSVLLE